MLPITTHDHTINYMLLNIKMYFLRITLILFLLQTLSACQNFHFSGCGCDDACTQDEGFDPSADYGCESCIKKNLPDYCPAAAQPEDESIDFIDYAKSQNSVFFDFNSDKIKNEATKRIDHMVYQLSKVTNVRVILYGYTDRVGGEKYNRSLSFRRANAVKKKLIKSSVIAENDIIIREVGYGKFDPFTSSGTLPNNPRSRRVDMYIINNNN